TRAAPGTSSRTNSNRFGASSTVKKLIPVRLPPGRESLGTRPSLTGSSPTTKKRRSIPSRSISISIIASIGSYASRRVAVNQGTHFGKAACGDAWYVNRTSGPALLNGCGELWPPNQLGDGNAGWPSRELSRLRGKKGIARLHAAAATVNNLM